MMWQVEDALEEQCHDLKCPITFELLVQPTDLHGKVSVPSLALAHAFACMLASALLHVCCQAVTTFLQAVEVHV